MGVKYPQARQRASQDSSPKMRSTVGVTARDGQGHLGSRRPAFEGAQLKSYLGDTNLWAGGPSCSRR